MSQPTSSTRGKKAFLKMIMLGESGVGKTNILVRFCDNKFN